MKDTRRRAKPQDRPYRLSKAEGDAAHAELWDDPACGRFVARMALFMRRGIGATDADELAERLHLRDSERDDRRMCVECGSLGGHGRCLAAAAGRLSGADPQLEPVPTILQRCEGFGPRADLGVNTSTGPKGREEDE